MKLSIKQLRGLIRETLTQEQLNDKLVSKHTWVKTYVGYVELTWSPENGVPHFDVKVQYDTKEIGYGDITQNDIDINGDINVTVYTDIGSDDTFLLDEKEQRWVKSKLER